MPSVDSVIDTLKVVVELDPSKFEEGRKRVGASFDETKVRARRTAEELESAGKQGAEFFNLLIDKALRLSAVLLGGVGIKDLIQSSIAGAAATGYMAKNIGISTQQLNLWQNAVREVGGSADQVGPALLGLSQALTSIQLHGKGSADLISAFQFLGITDLVDRATGQLKTVAQLLPEIHKGLARLPAPMAYNIGATLGLTPDMINLLRQTNDEYQKFLDRAARVSTLTEKQAKDLQNAMSVWGLYKSALQGVGYELGDDVAKAFDTITDKADKMKISLAALGAVAGAVALGFAGAFLGLPGLIGGAILGLLSGGVIGVAAERTHRAITGEAPPPTRHRSLWESFKDTVKNSLEAPGNQLPSFGRKKAPSSPTMAPAASSSAAPSSYEPSSATARDLTLAAAVFDMIQKLEGAQITSVTSTGLARDPYAYGRNQITLETARRYDPNVTAAKLLNAAYNDALAKKIEADYIERYHGDLDAIAIAYHNGTGAADRFMQSGRSLQGLGPQSLAYLERERALASTSNTTNTNTTTANIGSISVNAPRATDAAGIAADIRAALATNALLSQANSVGPQ